MAEVTVELNEEEDEADVAVEEDEEDSEGEADADDDDAEEGEDSVLPTALPLLLTLGRLSCCAGVLVDAVFRADDRDGHSGRGSESNALSSRCHHVAVDGER